MFLHEEQCGLPLRIMKEALYPTDLPGNDFGGRQRLIAVREGKRPFLIPAFKKMSQNRIPVCRVGERNGFVRHCI